MSDKTIDDDTLRAMIAARTPGEWAPYCDEGPIRYRYLAPDGDGWTYSVCVGGHGDDHTCVLTATGPDVATAHANAAMAAVAPALAAEVLRLRAEIERRDADHAEMECSEIERHQRMCAALDIPEEDRAYATDAEVEAAATDAVRERDELRAVCDDLHVDVVRARDAIDDMRARAEKAEAAARAYRDATDVPDGEYDATRHAEALAALNRVLGGGQ